MKSLSRILFLQLIVLVLFTACGDPEDPDDQLDLFTVTVDENPHVPGHMISYSSGENISTFCFAPSMSKDGEEDGLWMAETELTYALWKEVYDWATTQGYSMYYNAQAGSNTSFPHTHPVTRVDWYDAVVWCNAYTEYYNIHNGDLPDYDFVYTINGQHVKDADPNNTSFSAMTPDYNAHGFRLPTNSEWYGAARYPATPDDYASGAGGNVENQTATEKVAWLKTNSNGETHPVKGKTKNQLNLYDMSGNVSEIVFDRLDQYLGDYNNRGGAYNSIFEELAVGESHPIAQHTSSISQGFRIARTIGDDNHSGFEINNGGGTNTFEAGHGTGYCTMNSDTSFLTKAMIGDYNTLLQGGYLQLDIFSENLQVDKSVNGGYAGEGTWVGAWPIATDEATLPPGIEYLENPPLISAHIDFDAYEFPWEGVNGFIASEITLFSVELEDDIYTIHIEAIGTDHQLNENVVFKVFYEGTINSIIAGQDF